jgi:uncharacterized protein|tara:strand:+ start:441 stop:977 length:537 start_codon:yes stop_codon:yes gene_type:complete
MRFNLSQLLKESVGARRVYSVSDSFEPIPETGTKKVEGDLNVTRIHKGVWVSGKLEINIAIECGRCTELSDKKLAFDFNEEYLQTVEIENSISLGIQDKLDIKDGKFTLDSNHTLDLAEAIRQYAIINIPINPLCYESCSGLCSVCGVNLNIDQCECSNHGDVRWSPLKKLLNLNNDV